MRKSILLMLTLALPLALGWMTVTPTRARAAGDAAKPAGLELFTTFKCSTCHSIESQGVERKSKAEKTKGPDLSDVGDKHDAAWITGWLQHKEKKDGKPHKGQFKGTDDQLKELVGWLVTLKKS
jgi:mono/diheme cytochrome c family protein